MKVLILSDEQHELLQLVMADAQYRLDQGERFEYDALNEALPHLVEACDETYSCSPDYADHLAAGLGELPENQADDE